jgi:hypothetical protein
MHLAFGTAMAAFAETEFDAVFPVEMKTLITALSMDTMLNGNCLHRTASDTLETLLPDFVQAQLFFRNQRMITDIGIGHHASHAPGTAGGCNKLRVYTETSHITQIA